MTDEPTIHVASGGAAASIGLVAGVAAASVLLVAVIAIAILATANQQPTISGAAPYTSAAARVPSSSDKPAPEAVAHSAPAPTAEPPTVEEAFNTAYPTPKRRLEIDGRKAVATFSAYQLLPLSQTEYVLLTKGQNEEDFHAASGYVGITYFFVGGGLKPLHPTIVADASDGGWGNPPGLSLIHEITSNPVLMASSSFLEGGDMDTSVDLIDLPLDPDKLSIMGNIPISFSNGGAGKHCNIDGNIVNGLKDAWFQVVYSGSWSHTVTYKVESGKIVPQEKVGELFEHCPQEVESADVKRASPAK